MVGPRHIERVSAHPVHLPTQIVIGPGGVAADESTVAGDQDGDGGAGDGGEVGEGEADVGGMELLGVEPSLEGVT